MSLALGTIIDEKYEIVAEIGRGGFAVVYEACQRDLSRSIALKVISTKMTEEHRKRFEREAHIMGTLVHRNLLTVYGYGMFGQSPYLAMELIRGKSVDVLISEQGKLPPATAISIFIQAARGIACAHASGVVHRDLKPSNIVLADDETSSIHAKVIDFGLATPLHNESVSNGQVLTDLGFAVGTVHYMSPEQCLAQQADNRSDIYALGCVLHEMLTGQALYTEESTFGIMKCHVHDPHRRVNEVVGEELISDALQEIIDTCLAKAQADRYQSVDDLINALEESARSSSAEILRAPSSRHALEPTMRQPVKQAPVGRGKATLGAAAFVLIASVGMFAATKQQPSAPTKSSLELCHEEVRYFDSIHKTPNKSLIPLCEAILKQDAKDHLLSDELKCYLYCQLAQCYGILVDDPTVTDYKYEERARYERMAAKVSEKLGSANMNVYAAVGNLANLANADAGGVCQKEAIETILRLIKLRTDPGRDIGYKTNAMCQLAYAYAGSGDWEKVLGTAAKVKQLSSDDSIQESVADMFIGTCEIRSGDFASAVKRLTEAHARLSPLAANDRDLKCLIVMALVGANEPAEAERRLEDPDLKKSDMAISAALLYFAHQKQWLEANAMCKAILRDAHRHPGSLYIYMYDYALEQYANALQKAGKQVEATSVEAKLQKAKKAAEVAINGD